MTAANLITTSFGFESTAAEVIAGIDLSGKRAIVTGSSSGIGIETARALAGASADVTLAVRSTGAGASVAADITAASGNAAVHATELDLADPRSVSEFVSAWAEPLDLLVNNAGVMAIPDLRLTPQGWELQFATNHLGHFALAVGLHDALAAAPSGARIVSLSSRGHLRSPVVFDDINFASRPYEPLVAYGQSKTANVLFASKQPAAWPMRASQPTLFTLARSIPRTSRATSTPVNSNRSGLPASTATRRSSRGGDKCLRRDLAAA